VVLCLARYRPCVQSTPPVARRSLTESRARTTLTAIGAALVGLVLAPVILAVPLVPVAMVVLVVVAWNAWQHGVARQDAWRTVFVVVVAAVAAIVALFLVATLAPAFVGPDAPPAP